MAYIIKPLVSEKANTLTDKLNQFSFIVRPEANKLQIKAGLVRGRSNAFKKAIVTLKEGETIDFYSNI